MKIPKKQNTTLSYLFAASLLVPTSVVYAADETAIEDKVSNALSTEQSISASTEDASENLLDKSKEKLNTLIGKGEDAATEAKAEQQIETAKESQEAASGGLLDSAKEKFDTLTGNEENSTTETKTEIEQHTEAKSEENSEPGFFDKMKSKVHELTTSDSDDTVKDEQFVSE